MVSLPVADEIPWQKVADRQDPSAARPVRTNALRHTFSRISSKMFSAAAKSLARVHTEMSVLNRSRCSGMFSCASASWYTSNAVCLSPSCSHGRINAAYVCALGWRLECCAKSSCEHARRRRSSQMPGQPALARSAQHICVLLRRRSAHIRAHRARAHRTEWRPATALGVSRRAP